MLRQRKTVILHFGPYKTGSTSIQQMLASNRNRLAQENYCYPTEYIRADAHFGLHDDYNWHQMDASHLAGLGKVVARKKENTVVFSDECLSSKTTLYAPYERLMVLWRTLNAELESFDLKIIAYCRRQDDSAESRYLQAVKGQARHSDLTLSEVLAENSAVNLLRFANGLRNAFPKAELIFRPFSRDCLINRNVVADFLTTIGLDHTDFSIEDDSNVTPSGRYIRMMQLANNPKLQPHLVTMRDSSSGNGLACLAQKQVFLPPRNGKRSWTITR